MDLSQQIGSAFEATQIILVFTIFIFTMFYSDIKGRINEEVGPGGGEIAQSRLQEKVKETFWGKCFILILSNCLVFLLFLPVFYSISVALFQNRTPLNYEMYSFLLIFLFESCFLVWSIMLSYKILNKIRNLGKFTRFETLKYIFKRKKTF